MSSILPSTTSTTPPDPVPTGPDEWHPTLEQRLNHLKEAAANHRHRLMLLSTQARTPELRAALDLRAAEWDRQEDELHDLVVELCGAPQEGWGSGLVTIDLETGKPLSASPADVDLAAECIVKEDERGQAYADLMAEAALPATVHGTLARHRQACLDSVQRFTAMRQDLDR